MFLIPLIMLIYVNSYEDCMYVEKSKTIKNNEYNFNTNKWDDKTKPRNFTFAAEKVDDCKNRALRKYYNPGDEFYYDTKKGKNFQETFYEHCCFYTYDDMEKYEINELEIEMATITDFSDWEAYYNREEKVTKKEEIKGACFALTENQYQHIKEFIIEAENHEGKYKNLKIDCNTFYLQFFMISLFLIFLL